jgi:hypothetical protein
MNNAREIARGRAKTHGKTSRSIILPLRETLIFGNDKPSGGAVTRATAELGNRNRHPDYRPNGKLIASSQSSSIAHSCSSCDPSRRIARPAARRGRVAQLDILRRTRRRAEPGCAAVTS